MNIIIIMNIYIYIYMYIYIFKIVFLFFFFYSQFYTYGIDIPIQRPFSLFCIVPFFSGVSQLTVYSFPFGFFSEIKSNAFWYIEAEKIAVHLDRVSDILA
jgi:hypothetical protein